jgi:hypothetical protein
MFEELVMFGNTLYESHPSLRMSYYIMTTMVTDPTIREIADKLKSLNKSSYESKIIKTECSTCGKIDNDVCSNPHHLIQDGVIKVKPMSQKLSDKYRAKVFADGKPLWLQELELYGEMIKHEIYMEFLPHSDINYQISKEELERLRKENNLCVHGNLMGYCHVCTDYYTLKLTSKDEEIESLRKQHAISFHEAEELKDKLITLESQLFDLKSKYMVRAGEIETIHEENDHNKKMAKYWSDQTTEWIEHYYNVKNELDEFKSGK